MISVSDNTHDKKSDRKSDKKSAQSRRFSIYSVDRKKHVPYGPVDSRRIPSVSTHNGMT